MLGGGVVVPATRRVLAQPFKEGTLAQVAPHRFPKVTNLEHQRHIDGQDAVVLDRGRAGAGRRHRKDVLRLEVSVDNAFGEVVQVVEGSSNLRRVAGDHRWLQRHVCPGRAGGVVSATPLVQHVPQGQRAKFHVRTNLSFHTEVVAKVADDVRVHQPFEHGHLLQQRPLLTCIQVLNRVHLAGKTKVPQRRTVDGTRAAATELLVQHDGMSIKVEGNRSVHRSVCLVQQLQEVVTGGGPNGGDAGG
mmetsp:Transcript_15674/g.49072  ORF Transcript_15674/g.49072 Transcript_15674/m.49072 type:complete len:246 (+) Transcript_15674:181-918(+)